MTTSQLPLPTIDLFSPNLGKTMNRFLHQVKLHFGEPLHDIDDEVKVNYILRVEAQ